MSIPPNDSYRYAMLSPTGRQLRVTGYSERVKTVEVEWQGRKAQVLFVKTQDLYVRLMRKRWVDITKEIKGLEKPVASKALEAESPAAIAMLMTLRATGDRMTKGEVMEASEVSLHMHNWTKAINELITTGLVDRNGVGRNLRYWAT